MSRKTVNVALIGVGFMGSEHSKAYSLAPVIFPDIAAVPVKKLICDINEAAVKKNAEQWGYDEWCTDWKEVIAREDIDIVDICVPPNLHSEIAIEAMKAGKFVMSEKPLTTTVEDCEKLVEAAKKYNGRSAVAFNKRRWPAVNFARKLIKDGVIGKPLIYNGRYLQGGGDEFAKHYTFRSNILTGGGFADSCSHIVDMCRFILDDQYEEVVGTAEVFWPEAFETPRDGGELVKHERDAEDMSMIIARMKSGVTATLYQSSAYAGAGEDISFEVSGTKGMVRWSGANPSVFYLAQNTGDPEKDGTKSILMGPAHPYGQAVPPLAGFGVGVVDCMSFQAYEAVDACVNGTKYAPDFCDALEVIKVCDAVRESKEKKTWVKI